MKAYYYSHHHTHTLCCPVAAGPSLSSCLHYQPILPTCILCAITQCNEAFDPSRARNRPQIGITCALVSFFFFRLLEKCIHDAILACSFAAAVAARLRSSYPIRNKDTLYHSPAQPPVTCNRGQEIR